MTSFRELYETSPDETIIITVKQNRSNLRKYVDIYSNRTIEQCQDQIKAQILSHITRYECTDSMNSNQRNWIP